MQHNHNYLLTFFMVDMSRSRSTFCSSNSSIHQKLKKFVLVRSPKERIKHKRQWFYYSLPIQATCHLDRQIQRSKSHQRFTNDKAHIQQVIVIITKVTARVQLLIICTKLLGEYDHKNCYTTSKLFENNNIHES